MAVVEGIVLPDRSTISLSVSLGFKKFAAPMTALLVQFGIIIVLKPSLAIVLVTAVTP